MKSVTPVGTNSAMVRYATRRRDQRGQASTVQSSVAVLRYRYSGEPMRVADRFVNPPGFQVERYRRSMEVLPPAEPQKTVSATPA